MTRREAEEGPSARSGRQIRDLLPWVLRQISRRVHGDREQVLAIWPTVIGDRLSAFARAVDFDEGNLTIIVANSTLYSLLSTRDRTRLLRELRERLPNVEIKKLNFRMGS